MCKFRIGLRSKAFSLYLYNINSMAGFYSIVKQKILTTKQENFFIQIQSEPEKYL